MTVALLAAAALAVQVAFGLPGAPSILSAILLPMTFVVGPPLLVAERRWPHFALALGLAWDILLEPVVGPGAIAWSVAAVVVGGVVPLVADRSPRAWFVFGALGTAIVALVRALALLPLGLPSGLTTRSVLTSVLLTATWCAFVGWIIALDLPSRWRSYRARRLR